MRQARDENDRYNNSSGVVCAKLSRVFQNQSIYATTPITNFNFLTVGSPGAGKSMFQQAQIVSGLAMGEITYVIDLGHSYKHLCELVGGTYIDASNITLNPFTLFDFDGKTIMPDVDGQSNEVADNIQIGSISILYKKRILGYP